MRGVSTEADDKILYPSLAAQEATGQRIDFSATGFQLRNATTAINGNDKEYVYIAIRGRDAYVTKPPELATDVFAMDTGGGTTSIPNFDANFLLTLP